MFNVVLSKKSPSLDLLSGDLTDYRPWHKENSSEEDNQRALRLNNFSSIPFYKTSTFCSEEDNQRALR